MGTKSTLLVWKQTLAMEDFVTSEDSCRRIRLVMNMIGLLVLDITFTINTVDMVDSLWPLDPARTKMLQIWCQILPSPKKDFTNLRAFCLRVYYYSKNENKP